MSTNVGQIDLELLLNSGKFQKQLNSVKGQANSASTALTSSFKKIGAAVIAAFSVKKIVEFSKECLELGSNMAEVENVVDTAFPNMQAQVDNFANSCIESFGLSTTVAKKYLGTFGAMSKAFGFTESKALEMSETLTGLAGDVASFYNMSSDEAYTKLKSVFTGETETLKELGVVMTQTALDQYALANGYGKTTAKMTEQEKVALRYAFVQDQLSLATGDFIKTQSSWANQTRILTLRFQEFKATIGQGLINIFTPVIQVINTVLAKLQVLANAFKSFTEFITGNKSSGSSGVGAVANDLSNVTENANNASNAVGGIGSSAKKTAKEIKKSLAGFDEMNKLNSPDDADSGSGGGAGGGLDFGDTSNLTSSVQESTSVLSPFIEKMKELASIFKEGFSISFGDTNFDGILGHLKGIKNTIQNIFSDKDIQKSVNQWLNTMAYSLGQGVGAVARIGINIAEGLIGSIDKYLSQNSKRIKNFISTMFNISSKDIALTGNLWQALGEISDVFKGDIAKQIGADIIAMFANPFMSVVELCSKFATGLRGVLVQPIIDNADKIKTTFENLLQPIRKVTGTLAEMVSYVGEKWNEIYDTYMGPFMESLKTGLSDTFSKFLDVYNQYVVPFLDNLANNFGTLWEEHLKPFVDKVGAFIGSLISAIQTLWEMWLKPLVDWIVANIIPVLVPIFEGIGNTIMTVFGSIADTIGGIIDTFRGLIDFIVGVFTGDWNKAWEGIKTFFSGIWDAIKGIVSAVWNAIKGIVETAINIVSGIIQAVLSAIKSIWENIWNAICSVASSIWNAIVSFITNYINNVKKNISTVLNAIKTVWSNIWNSIKSVVSNIWNGITGIISNVINGIKNTITNVLNTIKNIWNSIWNGLKDTTIGIFNGIWNGIKGVINSILGGIEKMANGVINGLNGMTGAMNKLSFDVPDWVPGIGGGKFGFNIPKINTVSIPKLAEGGFVKANQPQLAMIGDNKTQGEIVAPENKILDMILTALRMFKEQDKENSARYQEIENVINVILDGEIIQRQMDKKKLRLSLATNGRR